MSAHTVQQILQKSGAKYVDSAKKDILGALSQFKDLSPGTESFMFPDGKRRTAAFKLSGTIPVYYKGACYNIPVTVILWETHPYYAPLCYVNPTATMVIKESENVNKEGKVFLKYLNEWRFPGYDLSGLLQMMAMVFQDKCPVFARSAITSSTQPSASSSASSTPTPYPSAQPAMPTPYPSGATPYPATSTPYPSAGGMGYNPYQNIPQPTPYPMGAGATPYPSVSGAAPPRPPPVTSQNSMGTIQADTIRASVLSAVEEKVRAKLRERIGTNSAEMSSIRATSDELREGQQHIKRTLEDLEGQRTSLQTAVEIYEAKRVELAKALQNSGGADAPPIDEAIDASYPLHRQIVQNYAKDLTCDDVIYALGQSLKKGKITLSEYLRHVRDVSREQFIYRATMQKCRRVAGLPI